jgi:hypothetical protein
MNSTIAIQVEDEMLSPVTLPALTNEEAAARFSLITGAMAALDSQIGRCTDPLDEKCLLTLRVEREIEYLETLYAWEFEPAATLSLR